MSIGPEHHLPPTTEQRIDAQLAFVQRSKQLPTGDPRAPRPFVTISREYGCEAMALAEMLSRRLAGTQRETSGTWQVYNRQIIESISRDTRLSDRLTETLDVHTRSAMEEFFQTLIAHAPSDLTLLHGLLRTVRALATHGYCIIVGRGGVVLSRGLPGGLHVRLIADKEWRRNNLINRFGWPPDRVQAQLHEEETSHLNFFKKYLGVDMQSPHLYDIVLNSSRGSVEEQCAAILAVFSTRFSTHSIETTM